MFSYIFKIRMNVTDEDGGEDELRNMDFESMAMDKQVFETFSKEMQDFMDRIVGDANLEKLRSDFEKIFKSLRGSYETERRYILKCKELSEKINEATLNFQTVMNASQAEAETMTEYTNRVTEAWKEVERLQEEEAKKKEQEKKFKLEIAQLQRLLDQPIHGTIEEMETIKRLKGELEELNIEHENLREKLTNTRRREEALQVKLNEAEEDLLQLKDERSKYERLVLDTKDLAKRKDEKKTELIRDTTELRERIEQRRQEKQAREGELRKLFDEIAVSEQIIEEKEMDITERKNEIRRLENLYSDKGKELGGRTGNKNMVQTAISELERTKESKEMELMDFKKQLKRLSREAEILKEKLSLLIKEKQKSDMTRNLLKQEIRDLNDTYERQKRLVEEERKEIEEKIHQRDVLNKKVVKTEEENLKDHGRLNTYENQLKKLKNKIIGFKNEAEKLHKKIY